MARTQGFIKTQGLDLTGPGLIVEAALDGLTAHAGGGQGSALQITTPVSRFTTVGSAGDSAVLPSAATIASLVPASVADALSLNALLGSVAFVVFNATATSMNIFPATGESINGLGANAAFALAGGKNVLFMTTGTAGQWHAILSA